MRHQTGGTTQLLQGEGDFRHQRWCIDTDERVGRPPRVDERAEDVKNRALPAGGERLAGGSHVAKGRMVGRCEIETVTQLLERQAGLFRSRLKIDTQRREQIGAAALGGDATIAVLHHWHPGTGQDQGDDTGDIETTGVVATRPHYIDGLGREVGHSWITGQTTIGVGKSSNFGG